MAFDYSGLQSTASELLTEFGKNATLRNPKDSALIDPDKPWMGYEDVETDYTVDLVFLNYALEAIDGTSILSGDQKVLLAGKGLEAEPLVNWQVIDGGETWQIVSVKRIKPASDAILYELQMRR